MGFNVLLLLIKGKDIGDVHRVLGVEPTIERQNMPEAPISGALLPKGGYLLYINDGDYPDDQTLAILSSNAALMTCEVSETVMTSGLRSWVDGVEEWSVAHDSWQGVQHLKVNGIPPDQLQVVQENLLAAQKKSEGVDHVFDIPVELFVALGGQRYDEDIAGADPDPWHVLKEMRVGRSWLSTIFPWHILGAWWRGRTQTL